MQAHTPTVTALGHYQNNRTTVQAQPQASEALKQSEEVAVPAAFVAHPVLSPVPAADDTPVSAQLSNDLNPAQESSFIPSQITFTGEATFDCDVRIAGTIVGTVSAAAGRSITVEKSATVNGTLKATNVRIDGTTEGEIQASGGLASFSASAVSRGHVIYTRLRISEGAEVEASMKKLAA